jgi:hypothetical protein
MEEKYSALAAALITNASSKSRPDGSFFFDKINRGLDQPDYKTQQRSANLDRSTEERTLGLATETDEWETRKRENPWRRKIKSGQRQLRENHADSAARKTNGRPKAERWQRLTGSKKIIC